MALRVTAAASAAAALVLALATTASADVQVRRDLRPGDVVRTNGTALVVPAPGQFVTMQALLSDGTQTVTAETQRDGTVTLSEGGTEPDPILGPETPDEPPLGRAIPACDDGAYARRAFSWSSWKYIKWKSTFHWRFRASTTPGNVSVDNARDALRRAVWNIVDADNDCGLLDYVSATQYFDGDKPTSANISTDGLSCTTGDGISVVAFGRADDGRFATTCLWGTDDGGTYGRITSSDTRLNSDRYSWYGLRPSGCQSRYSIEAVMTHAFGHTFGLANVSPEADHGWLTMSGTINGACQESESTLGLGDVRGLQTLY
ncbi:MAG TPA: hypothetical protein VGW75_17985 [Solirubrobacteraceae bacterium]|jgi:hypothetical protein|nr:hypothetical protein [Solirubrobacteraceae bacterium]